MTDGTIFNEQITASSNFPDYESWQARLGNTRSWYAKPQYPVLPWIQVEFVNITVITGIQVQGGSYWDENEQYDNWVETLQVQYEKDNGVPSYIMNGNETKVGVSLSQIR